MNFVKYKEINDTKMNFKEMSDATIISNYKNIGCGDSYKIFLKVQNGIIQDASYTTNGCGFGLTALAMITELAKNKTINDAENLTEEDIESMFQFPERRKAYPKTAIEAFKQAISEYKISNK